MVNTHHKEVLNASTSKGAEPSASDAEHDDNDNGSSSGSEGLNYRGFTEEETKALRSMINKQVGKAIKNVMPNEMTTYRDFTACDVPKFDGALDPISSTRWLAAVEGKVCENGEEWIGACTWKEFKELFHGEFTPAKEIDKIREEFQTLTQTNETVNEMWKKFNDLIRYCPEYHGNEKLKVESRARVREVNLLGKKNKEANETKRKIEFGDRDAKKPKHDQGRKSGGTQIKTPCKNCHKTHLGVCRANLPGHKSNECPNPKVIEAKPLKSIKEEKVEKTRVPTPTARAYMMATEEDKVVRDVVTGTILVNSILALVIQNTCSEKEDTASSKSVKEISLDSAIKDVHAIKYKMSKAKERCMAYFRSLHSHLQVLSKEDLKGTRIEHGFKRAFMSLFGQDVDTLTSIMLLNIDQLQKQLDKDEFQEDGSMAAFWMINNQIEVKHLRDTLLQQMGNVKKSVAERTHHQRQYDRRVNKRQMQTLESKIDTGKAVDDDLVVTKSSGIESEVQDDNSRSGNDTDVVDANIRPIYDEEPMAEVQLTVKYNIFDIGQQHTEQPEIINEGKVDQYPQCQVKTPMLDSSHDNQKPEYSTQSLESENILLKKTVAQFQKDFSRMKAHCIALELKYQNQALKSGQHGQILNETSNKAKMKKEINAFETINIELEHSVAKLLT
ncbi:gag-pol polyprotein [Tanacetum coccineum]